MDTTVSVVKGVHFIKFTDGNDTWFRRILLFAESGGRDASDAELEAADALCETGSAPVFDGMNAPVRLGDEKYMDVYPAALGGCTRGITTDSVTGVIDDDGFHPDDR